MLAATERQSVADAIAAVERRTDAELVTVLAARSDDYLPYALLWGAVFALLPAPLLVFVTTSPVQLALIELATVCAVTALLAFTPLGMYFVPLGVRRFRASSLARRQFLERGLHHTGAETGLLIFVSEAEHYVEILADRGIAQHVEAARWESIVAHFVADVHAERVLQGFLTTIESCGEILAEVCPATADNRNELDNRMVVIDERLVVIGYDD
jgi:putative membrane protein